MSTKSRSTGTGSDPSIDRTRQRHYATLDEYQLHRYEYNANSSKAVVNNDIALGNRNTPKKREGVKRDRTMDKSSKYANRTIESPSASATSGREATASSKSSSEQERERGSGAERDIRRSSPSKRKSMRPIAPPPSSNHAYVHPKRSSPQRERRREEHQHVNNNADARQSKPNRSPKRSERSERAMEKIFRKSAIQDVIKSFQCNDKTKVAPSTFYCKTYDKKSKSAQKQSNNNSIRSAKYPQPREEPNALDNSLLESDDEQSAFHPFDSESVRRDKHSNSRGNGNGRKTPNRSSPLKELFANPIKTCREQIPEEPIVRMRQHVSCLNNQDIERDSSYGNGDGVKDRRFLKLKNTWGEDELSEVFRKPSPSRSPPRRKSSDDDHDPFLGKELRGSRDIRISKDGTDDDEVERFKRAAIESVKKVIQFPHDDQTQIQQQQISKKALKKGPNARSSPLRTAMLDPSPRDVNTSRRSPHREVRDGRDGRERERSRSRSRSRPRTSNNVNAGGRAAKGIVKDQDHTPSRSSSVNSNGNLLDVSLSISVEGSPQNIQKNVHKLNTRKTPETGQTVRTEKTTPSPMSARSALNTAESNYHQLTTTSSETHNALQDVRLTLFEKEKLNKGVSTPQLRQGMAEVDDTVQDRTVRKLDHDRETKEKMIDGLKEEWKRSQLQIKRMLAEEVVEWFKNEEEAGTMMSEISNLKSSNERAWAEATAQKQEKKLLEEDNVELSKQLEEFKCKRPSKNRSDISDRSSDTGSAYSASTTISHSQTLTMKALIVDLKAQLSEKDRIIGEQKRVYDEKEATFKDHATGLAQSRKESKKDLVIFEAQNKTLQKSLELHKEQLNESENYVRELEKTIDDQLRIWHDEEETFREEVTGLRQQAAQVAQYEMMHRSSQATMKEMEQHLNILNQEVLGLRERADQSLGLERYIQDLSERHSEEIRILEQEKEALRHEVQKYSEQVNELKDRSISIDMENETQIKKLKEQLKHAAFRVQVMRNESPKRKRMGHDDKNDLSEETTISKLMEQLKAADAKAESAWKAHREAEESLLSMKSFHIDQSGNHNNDTRAEVEELTRKLHDATSRSRRITVKSEEESSKLRESESEMRKMVHTYEKEVIDLKTKLQKIEHQHSDEFASRKEIERVLRNELSLLREEKVSSAPTSPLPNSLKTHSNRIGEELKHLDKIASTLHITMNEILDSTKIAGTEDMYGKMSNSVDELRVIVSNVECAAEEDKLQIETAFVAYESAVRSYECQIEEVKLKMKSVKGELATCQIQRSEGKQKSKQYEIDILAKLNSVKIRLSEVQKEYDEYKNRVESEKEANQPTNPLSSLVEKSRSRPPVDNAAAKKKWKMKVQHSVSKGDVEMKLREDDSHLGLSTSSQNDFITSYRSMMEDSVIEAQSVEQMNAQTQKQGLSTNPSNQICEDMHRGDESKSEETQSSRNSEPRDTKQNEAPLDSILQEDSGIASHHSSHANESGSTINSSVLTATSVEEANCSRQEVSESYSTSFSTLNGSQNKSVEQSIIQDQKEFTISANVGAEIILTDSNSAVPNFRIQEFEGLSNDTDESGVMKQRADESDAFIDIEDSQNSQERSGSEESTLDQYINSYSRGGYESDASFDKETEKSL